MRVDDNRANQRTADDSERTNRPRKDSALFYLCRSSTMAFIDNTSRWRMAI